MLGICTLLPYGFDVQRSEILFKPWNPSTNVFHDFTKIKP